MASRDKQGSGVAADWRSVDGGHRHRSVLAGSMDLVSGWDGLTRSLGRPAVLRSVSRLIGDLIESAEDEAV